MAQINNVNFVKTSTAISGNFLQLSARFPEPLECLTAHLMLECSEVLAGIKPANLVSLVNRTRDCGRNLYQLWNAHHKVISARLGDICFKVLQTRDRALLLFCYQPEQLERQLSHRGIRVMLAKAGYDISLDSAALLAELCVRIEKSGSFPHEIGFFIGYPTKDVAAFMGMVNLPFSCQGPWKIYGEPGQSLCLADSFRRTRQEMGRQLASCSSPFDCLVQTESIPSLFLPTE